MQSDYSFIRYPHQQSSYDDMIQKSENFFNQMNIRRSIRDFSDKPVPLTIIENIIQTAGTAPSGAHKQPWTFCLVSNQELKKEIRMAAEKEEYDSYHGRMPGDWLKDLAPLGTDWRKPFLEKAPYLIVVFKHIYDFDSDGKTKNNYYVNESIGIATGFLISAIHQAGLCTLTHTPSPMDFLTKILRRPSNERPFLLLPVGFPADNALVPDISRKKMKEILVKYD